MTILQKGKFSKDHYKLPECIDVLIVNFNILYVK
jgi:hypothetical protein